MKIKSILLSLHTEWSFKHVRLAANLRIKDSFQF